MPAQHSAVPVPDPQEAFARELRRLRLDSGEPTEASLAKAMGFARSTVSALLTGSRFPSWPQTEAFVRALGHNPEQWLPRWRKARWEIAESKRQPRPDSEESAPLLTPPATGDAMLAARWYDSNPRFYDAAGDAARRARSEIRATYIRRYPPTHYTTPASARYFDAILEWASEPTDDERCVRRVIGIPERAGVPDKEMLAWARDHHKQTRDLLNYEAAVMRWATHADGLNMALFDNDVVFLAFSGGARQKLNGFSISDPVFMKYFATHFEQLWNQLQPLGAYLDEIGP